MYDLEKVIRVVFTILVVIWKVDKEQNILWETIKKIELVETVLYSLWLARF